MKILQTKTNKGNIFSPKFFSVNVCRLKQKNTNGDSPVTLASPDNKLVTVVCGGDEDKARFSKW